MTRISRLSLIILLALSLETIFRNGHEALMSDHWFVFLINYATAVALMIWTGWEILVVLGGIWKLIRSRL